LTPRNYKELCLLHDALYERGLRILCFPCNQFGSQEPGSAAQIRSFADGYGVRFDIFDKVDVNGERAHPVFRFVRAALPDILGSSIKWNWTKFLCDRNGTPIKRFSPPTSPLSLQPTIEELLDGRTAELTSPRPSPDGLTPRAGGDGTAEAII